MKMERVTGFAPAYGTLEESCLTSRLHPHKGFGFRVLGSKSPACFSGDLDASRSSSSRPTPGITPSLPGPIDQVRVSQSGGCYGYRTRLSPSSGARVIYLSYAAVKWSSRPALLRSPLSYQESALPKHELREDVESGAHGGNCTPDARFRRPALYLLSYTCISGWPAWICTKATEVRALHAAVTLRANEVAPPHGYAPWSSG